MMNIGFNPTVAGSTKSIEIHFFDFNSDLYGQNIQVDIIERIRDEHKFKSLEELKTQLLKDKETSISIISS
jgi:riboflavin kinase/FMN adenylyltransferase